MKKRILIVDDLRALREMMDMILTAAGFDVVQAVDGFDALAALQRDGADLIVTDINMPRLDGMGLIERLRSEPQHQATPILVITAEENVLKRHCAREAGATGWLIKPFTPVELLEAIRHVAGLTDRAI